MKHIKLFENFINEAEKLLKFTWKQRKKPSGRSGWGIMADRLPYDLFLNGETIISLNNSSGSTSVGLGTDDLKQWKIMIMADKGTNFYMQKTFEFDEVDKAKKYAEDLYTKIFNSDPETETDENIKKLKERVKTPIKKEKGPFKDIKKIFKDKFGLSQYNNKFGNSDSMKTFMFDKEFDHNGKIGTRDGRNFGHYQKMLQDALGDGYTVSGKDTLLQINKN